MNNLSLAVDRIREFVNSGSRIETMTDVIESISTVHPSYERASLFLDLWQETWNELDTDPNMRIIGLQ
ncbi:MAG: hypothetical protein WCE93_10610 [Nitrososphaeraceae archaeon]|jgi:hypothetical protein